MLSVQSGRSSVIFDSEIQDPSFGIEHRNHCFNKQTFINPVFRGVSRCVAFEFNREAFF